MTILTDYHIHTPLCQHAVGELEEYVDAAILKGLEEIGFADHIPLPHNLASRVRMREDELEYYVNEVSRLQHAYKGDISIKLGLEADFIEGIEDYIEEITHRYPFDYILGSVHYFDADACQSSWDADIISELGVDTAVKRYFSLLQQAIRTGLYDCIAHFDVIKRSCVLIPEEHYDEFVYDTLAMMGRHNLCIEINTSGFTHRGVTESYPGEKVIAQLNSFGVPVTVNSDAHAPHHVGRHFDSVRPMLLRHGIRELVRFDKRKQLTYCLA